MKRSGVSTAGFVAIVILVGIGAALAVNDREKRQARAAVQAEIYAEQEACIASTKAQRLAARAAFRKKLDESIEQSKESEAFKAAQRAVYADAGNGSGSVDDNIPLGCIVSLEEQARRVAARQLAQ